jgi:hypothetical protein
MYKYYGYTIEIGPHLYVIDHIFGELKSSMARSTPSRNSRYGKQLSAYFCKEKTENRHDFGGIQMHTFHSIPDLADNTFMRLSSMYVSRAGHRPIRQAL